METDDGWDSYAEGWDQDEAANAYAAAAFASLLDVLGDAALDLDGAKVIDFGCGTGLLTERLLGSGARIVAVDTSPAMLAVLDGKVARNGWQDVDTGAELPLPSPTGSGYDVVVASSVCSFLEDYPATTAQLVSLLEPGGVFVQWDWERSDDDDHGLSRTEIGDALRAAGLDDVVVDTAFVVSVGEETMRPLIGHGRKSA